MTRIETLNAYLAANPAAKAWIDEVLIRGAPGPGPGFGVIQGAHFVVGLETADPFGQPVRTLMPPFSAAEVPTGDTTPFSQVVGVVVIQQQNTIDAQAGRIAQLTADGAAKDSAISRLTADGVARDDKIAQLTADGVAKDDSISRLTTEGEAKDSTIAELTARVAELTAAEAAPAPE